MVQGIDWVGIVGAISGLSAFVALIVRDVRKPKLRISEGPYTQNWYFPGTTKVWRFVNFEVITSKGRTASRCVAKVSILRHPSTMTIFRQEHAIHWADVPYSGRSTSAEPVDIWGAPQRLDVAFTTPNMNGQSMLATPIALYSAWNYSTTVPQAVLLQGEYILKVKVSCENGKGDTKVIKLTSPQQWGNLEVEEMIVRSKLRRSGKRLYFEKAYLPKGRS